MTFDDVKGCDEAKQELQEVVEFLMNPDKFSALGQTRILYVTTVICHVTKRPWHPA